MTQYVRILSDYLITLIPFVILALIQYMTGGYLGQLLFVSEWSMAAIVLAAQTLIVLIGLMLRDMDHSKTLKSIESGISQLVLAYDEVISSVNDQLKWIGDFGPESAANLYEQAERELGKKDAREQFGFLFQKAGEISVTRRHLEEKLQEYVASREQQVARRDRFAADAKRVQYMPYHRLRIALLIISASLLTVPALVLFASEVNLLEPTRGPLVNIAVFSLASTCYLIARFIQRRFEILWSELLRHSS